MSLLQSFLMRFLTKVLPTHTINTCKLNIVFFSQNIKLLKTSELHIIWWWWFEISESRHKLHLLHILRHKVYYSLFSYFLLLFLVPAPNHYINTFWEQYYPLMSDCTENEEATKLFIYFEGKSKTHLTQGEAVLDTILSNFRLIMMT